MFDFENFYNKFNVDKKILKRDYEIYPLKHCKNIYDSKSHKIIGKTNKDYPEKEDLEYLYLTLNINRSDLIKYFNISITQFKRFCKKYNIFKNYKLRSINIKNTFLLNYGVDNPQKCKTIQEKTSKTSFLKYGNSFFGEYHKLKEKAINNKSLIKRASTDEKIIYLKLKEKFKNIKFQYYCKKYPFPCDFYIPSLDLFIEYQGHWTHGCKPFEETKEDLEKVASFVHNNGNRKRSQYLTAIQVWTIKDPLKRKIAKENGLNWIEFFKIEDFFNWYNKL